MAYDEPKDRYEFSFAGGEQNLYYFTTSHEIIYEIKFVPSDYLFIDYVEGRVKAFEMVIAVADNPTGKRIPADLGFLGMAIQAQIYYRFNFSLRYSRL